MVLLELFLIEVWLGAVARALVGVGGSQRGNKWGEQ